MPFKYFAQNRPQAKWLTCYSDSCFGQNKNTQMTCFWRCLIFDGQFVRIDHKFLVRGHTYLPNDRDFTLIEKKKGSAMVHLPEDREEVVRDACPSKPFQIQRMNKDDFLDLGLLTKNFTMRKKVNLSFSARRTG